MLRVRLASGIELAVADRGPRDAPALVFLHGFPENHRTWRHQVAHLSDRFRCIAPDQRGYGASDKPPALADYAVANLVGDVFGLADALGLERFALLGHDWGGAIAWLAAALGQATGRIERLVIANAPHPARIQELLWTDPDQRAASQYIRAFRDPAHDDLVREQGLGALLLKALAWKRPPPLPPDERAALLREWADPERAFAMLNWYRASTLEVPPPDAPYRLPDGYEPPPLPPIALPTLVIWALGDEALVPANARGLGRWAPRLELVEVQGSGHFVPWEAPDAVNAALDAFLGQPDECRDI